MKVKWIGFKTSLGFSNLADALSGAQYTSERFSGFVINQSGEGYLSAKHVSKRHKVSVSEGPFGEQIENEIVVYDIVNFSLTKDFSTVLELKNPPRRLREFFSDLSGVLGIGTSFYELQVDVLNVIKSLEHSGIRCDVRKANISDVYIGGKTNASLVLKGSQDIRNSMLQFLEGKNFSVRKALVKSLNAGQESIFSLSSSCSLAYEGEIDGIPEAVKTYISEIT